LATVSGCAACHTPVDDNQQPESDREFAGGREFKSPFGTVVSPNITFHETGLASWSEERFVKRFRRLKDESAIVEVNPRDNTPMPWIEYSGVRDEDLGAIYQYLKSVPRIDHAVTVRSKS
jgi:hypothetical protein